VGNQFHAVEGAGSHRGAAGGEVLRRKTAVTAGGASERRRKTLESCRRFEISPGRLWRSQKGQRRTGGVKPAAGHGEDEDGIGD
jgi:hypothetical protein